jgi:Protein of unknown function (DUF3105)
MILLVLAGSAALVIAAVAGFLLLGSGGGSESAATEVGAKFRALGGSFQTLPAAPNLRFKGQKLRHVPAVPKGFKYNSNPPSSGIHRNQTVLYNIYEEPVDTLSTVHNLEHGGVVIRYGPDVPAAEIEKMREFYFDDPNGLVIAPMPGLGDTIALTAWTSTGDLFDQAGRTDRSYDGEGRIAKVDRFDDDAFNAFVDAFRAKGPERLPLDALLPGRG